MITIDLYAFLLFAPQVTNERDGVAPNPPRPPAPAILNDVPIGRTDPDLLIILADDFNWVDLASVTAPNIAALASQGMTFRNAYTFPMCSITRYSLTFGRYPRRDGIGMLVDPEPPGPDNPTPPIGLPSLPSVLRWTPRSVYESALIGKWHLGTSDEYDGDPGPDVGPADIGALTPLMHGYDRFLAGMMANPMEFAEDYFGWTRVDDGVYSFSNEYSPQAQLDAFLGWWPTAHRRIAVLAPNLAHTPLDVPPIDWLPPGYPWPNTPRKRMEAMLVAFDTMVGRVLEAVDLARTYVFLLVDNGTQTIVSITPCSPHADSVGCTKRTVFQGGINVPFFVAGPGIPAGTTTDAVVSSTDVMATLAEILGVYPSGEDSISFAPVLFDPAARTRRIAFSEIFGTYYDEAGNPYFRQETAAIGERYKMRRVNGVEFFFDLQDDPGETDLLNPDHPHLEDIAQELRAVLDDPLDRSLQEY